MRQTHPAGERMFVDYAGQTAEVIDGATGEVRRAQVFVAVLGASNYTYAEARWTQSLRDWIGCHVGAFASFGGAARQIVCDNLKAGLTAASRYEPGISRSYQDMATHYGTATGHVLMTPRTRIGAALTRNEARYTGVYLLMGELEGEPRAYIGEAEDISDRIRNHDTKKDWWTSAVLVYEPRCWSPRPCANRRPSTMRRSSPTHPRCTTR